MAAAPRRTVTAEGAQSRRTVAAEGAPLRRTVAAEGGQPPLPGKKQDRLGPRGLAWLLERVADFGPEDPPWRRGPALWRSQPAPPPLQLLVPETVVLDPEARLPCGVFYTDGAGFLRCMRRSVRQDPHVFFEAIIQLMRGRQQLERDHDREEEEQHQQQQQPASPTSTVQSGLHGRAKSVAQGGARLPSHGLPSATGTLRNLEVSATNSPRGGFNAGRRRASTSPHGHTTRSMLPRSHMPLLGSWRLLFANGTEEQLSDSDIRERIASAGDARCCRWPPDSRLLQASFWLEGLDHSRCLGIRQSAEYHYEAMQGEATGNDPKALEQIVTNHFERFRYLDNVCDRARISALPVLISQHLAYLHGLELVSGDFTFERDCRGQLWLTDAKELYFLYSSQSRSGVPGDPAGEKPAPLKLFRYLSEEALNNLPLADDTGQKCRHMLDLMRDHYGGVRQTYDVDSLLKKREEVLEVNIPILEGTDRRALAKTFGLTAGKGRAGTAPGRAAAGRGGEGGASGRRCPATPRSRGIGCSTPRPLWAEARARGSPPAAAAKAPEPSPLTPAMVNRKGLLPEGAVLMDSPRGRASFHRAQTVESAATQSSSHHRGSVDGGARRLTSKPTAPTNIEIVATAEAQRLVVGAGPGAKPQGPTLDSVIPASALTLGAGLREKRRTEKPTPRLVEVPQGAFALLAASRAAASQASDGRARAGAGKGRPSTSGKSAGADAAEVPAGAQAEAPAEAAGAES